MSKDEKIEPSLIIDPRIWGGDRPSFDSKEIERLRAKKEADQLQELRSQCREDETEISCALRLMDESLTELYESTSQHPRFQFLLSLLIRRIRMLRELSLDIAIDAQKVQVNLCHFVRQVEDELLRTNARFDDECRTHLASFRILFKCLSVTPPS